MSLLCLILLTTMGSLTMKSLDAPVTIEIDDRGRSNGHGSRHA